MDNQALMQPVYDSTKKLGFVGLTYYDSGQRSFYMSKGPVTSPDDLKGKKIRVMQSETAIKMVELLGVRQYLWVVRKYILLYNLI